MAEPKFLRNVTDSFSLFDTVRKYTDQNDRRYLVSGLRDILMSPKIQEHRKLRELLGYFGHEKRRLYAEANGNNLRLPENAVMVIDGKVMDVVNIPTNVCIDISVSDDGIVTHTEQVLDNELGQIVSGLIDAKVGGWSWATRGSDGAVSNIKDFAGFDYVYGENFISIDKSDLMFESSGNAEEKLLERLKGENISQENALSIITYLNQSQRDHLIFESAVIVPTQQMEMVRLHRSISERDDNITAMNAQILSLQSKVQESDLMLEKVKTRDERMERIISALPVFVDKATLNKILNPENEDDVKASQLFFESVGARDLASLPMQQRQRLPQGLQLNTGIDDQMPSPMFTAGPKSTGFE